MEIFTLVTIYMAWEFYLDKTDKTSSSLKQYTVPLAIQMGNIFEQGLELEQYQRIEVNQMRERNGSIVIDHSLVTLEVPGRYDNDTVFHQELESILGTALTSLNYILLGRPVQASDPFSIGPSQTGEPLTTYKYVYVASSFVLDEPFKRVFLDKHESNSEQFIQAIQTLLNPPLKESIDKFQFAFVTMLRSVKRKIGLDILLAILSEEGKLVDASLIQTSVETALTKVLSDGQLGSYNVVYKDSADIMVEQPFEGSPNQLTLIRHVYTPISIRIETKFLMGYINISNVEAKLLTTVIEAELEQTLVVVDDFQFAEVVLIKLTDEDCTMVDLEVVSLGIYSTFDPVAHKEAVNTAVDKAIKKEKDGQHIGSYVILDVSVLSSSLRSTPTIQKYAITKVSVTLQTKFKKAFTHPESNETQLLKTGIETELKTDLAQVKDLQFANVVMLRCEDDNTVVDIHIASLTTDEEKELVMPSVEKSMTEGTLDGDLGGYKVDTSDASAVKVEMPMEGVAPPVKVYAFTRATLQLKEPWKKVYRDVGNPETQKLISSVEEELNYGFELKGENQIVDVIDIWNNDEDEIDLNFNVATLTIEDEFNTTLISETMIEVMKSQVEDGDIAGYSVNANVMEAFTVGKSNIGFVPPSNKERPIDGPGIGEPGTPKWITSIVIGVCCIAGTVILVAAMWTAVRKKETMKKQENISDENSTTMTKNTAVSQESKGSSTSSDSSAEV